MLIISDVRKVDNNSDVITNLKRRSRRHKDVTGSKLWTVNMVVFHSYRINSVILKTNCISLDWKRYKID